MNNHKALRDIINLLERAAELADRHVITLDNGAFVGSIVGTIADELSARLERENRGL